MFHYDSGNRVRPYKQFQFVSPCSNKQIKDCKSRSEPLDSRRNFSSENKCRFQIPRKRNGDCLHHILWQHPATNFLERSQKNSSTCRGFFGWECETYFTFRIQIFKPFRICSYKITGNIFAVKSTQQSGGGRRFVFHLMLAETSRGD